MNPALVVVERRIKSVVNTKENTNVNMSKVWQDDC
jgi:hypothetical protein